MNSLLLLALLLQEPTVESRIDAFLKGDAAARAELVKLGAFAIRPLQKARDKAPEKIDALVYELKKAAAHPKCEQAIANLQFTKSIVILNAKVETTLRATVESVAGPTFVDALDVKHLREKQFTLQLNNAAARVILDELCRQTGLDYGFFHNHLVIGHPDRLWPSGPPEAPRALTADELACAKALIEKLGDDLIENREAAMKDLLAFGSPVVPLLRANLDRKEAELAARCKALVRSLEFRPRGVFGPSLSEGQKRSKVEEMTLKQLQSIKADLQFSNQSIADIAGYLNEFTGVPFEIEPEAGKRVVTMQMRSQRLVDALCLLTQPHGLDFLIRDRKVIIDTREAIEKMLLESK